MTHPDDNLMERFIAEMTEAERDDPSVEMSFNPSSLFYLVANLQLALRHPQNDGAAAEFARLVCSRIEEHFQARGYAAMCEMIRRGWTVEPERVQ
jgi:hypothetical protein